MLFADFILYSIIDFSMNTAVKEFYEACFERCWFFILQFYRLVVIFISYFTINMALLSEINNHIGHTD